MFISSFRNIIMHIYQNTTKIILTNWNRVGVWTKLSVIEIYFLHPMNDGIGMKIPLCWESNIDCVRCILLLKQNRIKWKLNYAPRIFGWRGIQEGKITAVVILHNEIHFQFHSGHIVNGYYMKKKLCEMKPMIYPLKNWLRSRKFQDGIFLFLFNWNSFRNNAST